MIVQVLVGALAGALASLLHQRLLARAIARGVARRRASSFLVSAPLRVAIPALVLVALARWGAAALIAGAIGLGVAAAIGVARSARARAPTEEEAPR